MLEEKKGIEEIESILIMQKFLKCLFLMSLSAILTLLRRFERYITAQKWKKKTVWQLISALYFKVVHSMYMLFYPRKKATDYDALKTALFKRFEKTEDGFRQKFRRCRPEVGETFLQFSVRLSSYLDRCVEQHI